MKLSPLGGAALLMAASMNLAVLQSCTLDDPKNDNTQTAESQRLVSVSSFMVTLVQYQYDSQGRVVAINDDVEEQTVRINYGSPMSVEVTEYNNGTPSYRTFWNDITLSSAGYITSMTIEEYYLDYATDQWTRDGDPELCSLSYDSQGHLTRMAQADDIRNFQWRDGDLYEINMEGDETETVTFTYTEIENKAAQWGIDWPPLNTLFPTRLFGKAPAHYPASCTADYETIRWAYSINNLGMIGSVQTHMDGETITYTYNYAKK